MSRHNTTSPTEIWMKLKDRKALAKLMAIQGVSARELARVAGWRSHTYIQRLLKGEATTLRTDPALRIAHRLGVGVDDLFLVGASTKDARSVHRERTVA